MSIIEPNTGNRSFWSTPRRIVKELTTALLILIGCVYVSLPGWAQDAVTNPDGSRAELCALTTNSFNESY